MTIGYSRDIDKPMDAYLTTSFHLDEGEELYLVFQKGNSPYGIGEAHIDCSVYLDCKEVSRVMRMVSLDEFPPPKNVEIN